MSWSKYSGNPIFTDIDGYAVSVIKEGDYFYMFFQRDYNGKRAIWRAKSPNGLTDWVIDPNAPVLQVGESGDWDDKLLHVPNVWKENGYYYMIYGGRHEADNKSRACLARSTDMVNWEKWNGTGWGGSASPILEPEYAWENEGAGTEPWTLIKVGDTYYLWYNNLYLTNRKMGLATSTDLINWSKDPNNPLFVDGRFCPCPYVENGKYILLVCHYTSGSDYSEIEIYEDVNPTFYPEDRVFKGIAWRYGDAGEWDSVDIDTPWVLTTDITRTSFPTSSIYAYYGGYDGTTISAGLAIKPIPVEKKPTDIIYVGGFIKQGKVVV